MSSRDTRTRRVLPLVTIALSGTAVLSLEATAAAESGTIRAITTFSGQFTAQVTLTANFGGGSDQPRISSTISDFRDVNGNAIDPAWEVSLGGGGAEGGVAMGSTNGGGSWKTEFHGSTSATEVPGSIVGTFDAHFANGHVGGALAAHKQ